MHESLYDFCRRNGRSGLLDQWDTERNGARRARYEQSLRETAGDL